MAFVPVPNGVKIEQNALQNGIPVVNVYHVTLPGTPTLPDLASINGAMVAWWEGSGRDLHSSSYVLQNFTATDVSVANGIQDIESTIPNPTGSVSGTQAAANAAGTVSWRTGFTGRSYRGRTFYGGLANVSLFNAQTLDGTWITVASLAAADLISGLQAVSATLVVVSKFLNGVQRLVAVVTEITSYIIDTKVDSQRRRTAN